MAMAKARNLAQTAPGTLLLPHVFRLFADELFLMYDNMIFKAGETIFYVSIISPAKL
jgi:hypothetical protein